MIKGPKLTPAQWKHLASAFSNISQAIMLFSAAAFFAPEAIGLAKDFSKLNAITYFTAGVALLWISVTILKKEK